MRVLLLIIANIVASPDSTLTAIQKSTAATARNTVFDFWDGMALFIAFVALVVACLDYNISRNTLKSQEATEGNTQRLDLDYQRTLLLDLIRHLYRNMVIAYTMFYKMENPKNKNEDGEYLYYPSEEHLIKLMIPLENVHLNVFYGQGKEVYQKMSNLYLNFRNYNEEIQIAMAHFKNSSIDYNTKLRDFKTLLYKCGYLTSRIIETAEFIWPEQKDGIGAFKEAAQALVQNTFGKSEGLNTEEYIGLSINKDMIASYELLSGVEFENAFRNDVFIECGDNPSGGEKVHLIKV